MAATLSAVHRAIIDAIRAIPPGRVASYGQIASIAGCAGRARLVGWTLRHAPPDAKLPWFRVLRADGAIAFPDGSNGHVEQVRRLARERVAVVRGRVDLARFGWRRTLDELLWAPPSSPSPTSRRRAAKSVAKSVAKKAATSRTRAKRAR